VLKGARAILASDEIKEVFIEVDQDNMGVFDVMRSHGFDVSWQIQKEKNLDVLFAKAPGDEATT